MPELVAGIDAGGTSLRIRLADATGAVVMDLEGAASADLGPDSMKRLLPARDEECHKVRFVCAGIAGITRQGMKERWHRELAQLFPGANLNLNPDYTIAYYGAIADFGILTIAGTGSVIYGENGNRTCRVGGRGWEWGDWGSGGWITAELLRLTLNALDGLSERSPLVEAICTDLDTRDPIDLRERALQMCQTHGRGFLAPLAVSLGQSGDKEAIAIFDAAGKWLSRQVEAAAGRLEFDKQQPFPVATVGGLWESEQLLVEPFTAHLNRVYPNAFVTAPLASSIEGATRQALSLLKQKTV